MIGARWGKDLIQILPAFEILLRILLNVNHVTGLCDAGDCGALFLTIRV